MRSFLARSIEAGASIERSIIGPGATIGAGAQLEALTVVGADTSVEAGTQWHDARIPSED